MKKKDIECKLWVFMAIVFAGVIIIFTYQESIFRLIYGKQINFSKGVMTISGKYFFIPGYKKYEDNLKLIGDIYWSEYGDLVCIIFDIDKIKYNKKPDETNYQRLKKRWLQKGYMCRKRKLGNLNFDEWYTFENEEAGHIVIIFPEFNLVFSFSNTGYIDDFLRHIKFKENKN